jgi:hypothetical protein
MFEWLLIGIELAILYFAFWFVFIKKPDVYTIKGDPWGTYDTSPDSHGRYEDQVVQMPNTKPLFDPRPGKNAA